jgi:sialic acid synthase SpsE
MKVIAEAGVNFHSLEEAIEMINRSKEAGCWATKFQMYNDELIKDHPKRSFLKSIMIDKTTAVILLEHGREIGQKVFFTPMFPEALDWCEGLGISIYKIRYADQSNLELVNQLFNSLELFRYDECFISTDYPNLYYQLGFYPLFCVPKYPATFEDYKWIRRKYDSSHYLGISDHTPDLELLKYFRKYDDELFDIYFEKHVKLNWNCLEAAWSVTFKELEEVLK